MASLDLLSNDTLFITELETTQRSKRGRYGYRIKPSMIADDCERRLWFDFRWATRPEGVDAKMQRVFAAGHAIEKRFLNDMKETSGLDVETHVWDERKQEDKQIGVSFASGHGYGFLDGQIKGFVENPLPLMNAEVKSMKQADFNAVRKHGVKKKKPLHYGQMQVYMHANGALWTAYCIECKNTHARHIEFVEYDEDFARSLEIKANNIWKWNEAPARVFTDPEVYPCTFCPHTDLCWGRTATLPEKTCRTCAHVTPEEGGFWRCSKDGDTLSRSRQEGGCDRHLYNPHLVPGEVVGGDGVTHVEYLMVNDDTYVDRVRSDDQ